VPRLTHLGQHSRSQVRSPADSAGPWEGQTFVTQRAHGSLRGCSGRPSAGPWTQVCPARPTALVPTRRPGYPHQRLDRRAPRLPPDTHRSGATTTPCSGSASACAMQHSCIARAPAGTDPGATSPPSTRRSWTPPSPTKQSEPSPCSRPTSSEPQRSCSYSRPAADSHPIPARTGMPGAATWGLALVSWPSANRRAWARL